MSVVHFTSTRTADSSILLLLPFSFIDVLHRYWYDNGCLFPDMGTVFIAIDKCDRENGCLKV